MLYSAYNHMDVMSDFPLNCKYFRGYNCDYSITKIGKVSHKTFAITTEYLEITKLHSHRLIHYIVTAVLH